MENTSKGNDTLLAYTKGQGSNRNYVEIGMLRMGFDKLLADSEQ